MSGGAPFEADRIPVARIGKSVGLRGDLRLLPGGVYLVHARKRVSRIVPLGLARRPVERLIGAGVTEPTP